MAEQERKETEEWIAWDRELDLGHPAMDSDHRKLISLVNALADSVVNQGGDKSYEQLLNDLLSHTQAHFRMEEELMAEQRYPMADEHRSEHARLVNDALDFKGKFTPGTQPSVSLLYFFEQWLTRHISTSDKALADFLSTPH